MGTFTTNQWHHVYVNSDYAAKTFEMTLDNNVTWQGAFAAFSGQYGNASFSGLAVDVGGDAASQGVKGYYDNVSMQIPEPSALLLLASGVLVCAWRKRK